MELEYFVESIGSNSDCLVPSVMITLRNHIESIAETKTFFADSKTDMKKIMQDILSQIAESHRTSFMIGLNQYRKSNIQVGDRLVIKIERANNGEIST